MSATARVVTWNRTGAVELQSGATTAVVVPELGMLVASFVVDGVELIARPGGLGAYRAGHTTAVPLLYPWANRLARRSYRAADATVSLRGLPLHTDANRLPIHGTMTARPDWEVIAVGAGKLRARFDFGAHPDLLASFPFPHELEVAVSVTRGRLRVQTAVRASGGCAVPVSFGWHPYWKVPGPRGSWIVGLSDVAHLRLDRRGIPTGGSHAEPRGVAPLRGRELDDLYAFSGPRRSATLEGGGRRLRLDLDAGYPYLQIYAPGDGRFCCLEPMTAPTNALVTGDHRVVPAGEAFTATFVATVS